MTLRHLWRGLPIVDPRVKQQALSELLHRLQSAGERADAAAAQRALDTLQSGAEFCCEECVLRAVRCGYGCCGDAPTHYEKVWIRRVLLNRIRLVIMPLAAWTVQGAWRRRRRRERARLVIQRACLDLLWRPGGWVCARGAVSVRAATFSHFY